MTTNGKHAAPMHTHSVLVEVTRLNDASGPLVAYHVQATEPDGQWARVAFGAVADERGSIGLRKELIETLGITWGSF